MPQQIEIRINQASDEEIVDLYLKTQKDKYFSEIYKRYSGKIFGKCLSFFKEEAEASDAVHDVFMKILVNLSKFGKIKIFHLGILYHLQLLYRRHQKKQKNDYSVYR